MKCDVCGSTIRKAFGVYPRALKAGKLKVKQSNLAICQECNDILNLCNAHGWYSSEWSNMYFGHGDKCPVCYGK